MKIYYEDTMPYGDHFFSGLGECLVFNSQSISADSIQDADVLLVRSTTKVNEKLLHKARDLKFVATATAGTDHMDTEYLTQREIPYSSAAGCNAIAVAEYVISCLLSLNRNSLEKLATIKVGIVGAGYVGTALAGKLAALGIDYVLYDPPLQQHNDPRKFVSFDEICQCDVISLHVPLQTQGEFATLGMFDYQRLRNLRPDQLLINACRGEVVDNQALLKLFEAGKPLNLVLDVWENEPEILFDLIPHIAIATQHIAGHTLEGKARGTFMLYQQLAEFLGVSPSLTFESCLPVAPTLCLEHNHATPWQQICDAVLSVYDVKSDSDKFKTEVTSAKNFVYSRKHYAIRREFSSVPLKSGNFPSTEALYSLGFLLRS